MTIQEALREGRRLLTRAGSDEAEIEAELLLAHALGLDRVRLYQGLREELPSEGEKAYRQFLDRRLAHEPTAYILGRKEFYGLDFEVSPAALIPRPETEVLVEAAIGFARERFGESPFALADVGVGCGTIAVAIAHSLPQTTVFAIDRSHEALALARRNARRYGLEERIRFLEGDLLAPLPGAVEIIAANLPYVPTPDWEQSPPEIREREPREALDGGPDGLRVIARLLEQASSYLKPGGCLLAEIGDEQGAPASSLARRSFQDARIEAQPDLAGRDRVLLVEPR